MSIISAVGEAGLGPRDLDHLRWLEGSGFASVAGMAVLDLGCGGGYLCREVARRGARHVVGVDIEPVDPRNLRASWTFAQADFDTASWPTSIPHVQDDQGFDLICGFDIIEHLQSPPHFLRGCHQLLAAGGCLLLTTPNISSWERMCRGARWSGATDPQHRILFNRYSLTFLLEREGFKVRSVRAPVRAFERRRIAHPPIGAQLIAVAERR